MGITPITNLIPLPQPRSILADLEPLPMQRVEYSPRTADETYSPSGGKSARGSADDAFEADAGDAEEESGNEAEAQPEVIGEPRAISFFA